MRDNKQQRCVQQHKSLKVTRNATNGDKHINEAFEKSFAITQFTISSKCAQGMLSYWKIFFNAFNIRVYDEVLKALSQINETVQRLTYTSQFDVS